MPHWFRLNRQFGKFCLPKYSAQGGVFGLTCKKSKFAPPVVSIKQMMRPHLHAKKARRTSLLKLFSSFIDYQLLRFGAASLGLEGFTTI
jgi:hypothetical protein